MLGKLIKHEFRATGRRMLPVLGVLLLLAVMASLSIQVLDRELVGGVFQVLLVLLVIAFFVGIIVAWIMALVVMISRFYRNLLGDEGYLMFTLPTNSHALLWSKLIVSTVWFFATALVIFLAVLILVLPAANLSQVDFSAFGEELEYVMDMLHEMGVKDASLWLLGGQTVLMTVLGCLAACLQFYAAMSIGQCFANHKVLYSVLAFIALGILFDTLSGTIFSGLINSGSLDVVIDAANEMTTSVPGMLKLMNTGMSGAMLLSLIYCAILYGITALCLNRKLNLA